MGTCVHPGCTNRPAPDILCSIHDGNKGHGDICHCATPQPIANDECGKCRHLILSKRVH